MSLDYAKPTMGVFAGFLLVALGLAVLWLGSKSLLRGYQSKQWPATTAVVTKSEYEVVKRKESRSTTTGGKSTSTSVDVDSYYTVFSYRYRVGATPYSHDRVSFSNEGLAVSKQAVTGFLKQYPLGAEIMVHVNPDDPTDAVIEPGARFKGLGVTIGVAAFIAFPGLVIIYFSLRTIRKIRFEISSGKKGPTRIRLGG